MSIRFWQGVVHYNTLSVKVILVAHCSLVAVPPPGQVGTPRIIVVPGLSAAQSAQKVVLQFTFSSVWQQRKLQLSVKLTEKRSLKINWPFWRIYS